MAVVSLFPPALFFTETTLKNFLYSILYFVRFLGLQGFPCPQVTVCMRAQHLTYSGPGQVSRPSSTLTKVPYSLSFGFGNILPDWSNYYEGEEGGVSWLLRCCCRAWSGLHNIKSGWKHNCLGQSGCENALIFR